MSRNGSLMIVDDDPDVLTAARLLLCSHFHRVITAEDPADIERVLAGDSVDVFLLDMNFAIGRNTGAEGLHWLERIRTVDPDAVVVLMTAFGDLNTAVEAMRLGAADFVLKPWQNDKLVATLSVASALRRSRARISEIGAPPVETDMIAESPSMKRVLSLVDRVAPTDANVLIRGENGTGKELVAAAIHRQSTRAGRVMVAVDLGAVAESLFESELFGHRKGAFTDATSDRAGRFQAADGGSLFLDEIGNLPPALQTRLLRVLESREVVPLGSDEPIPVDVRLISATNQPIEDKVAEGGFREDLLYRINTIEIVLPPLRERPEDISPLAEHFMRLTARRYRKSERGFSQAALGALSAHTWPGNVREFSHVIERAMILSDGDEIDAQDLNLEGGSRVPNTESLNLAENERRLIERALAGAGGNISHAAATLGITRAALYRRKEKYGL